MASLYSKSGSSANYVSLASMAGGGGVGGVGATAGVYNPSYTAAVPVSSSYTPYGSDPLSLYSSSYSAVAPSGVSWAQMDPLYSSLKRPGEEVIYNADILSKRARADVSPVLSTYPQRPGEKDCVYYMRTRTCNFGATCKFNHPTWIPAGGIPDWKEASNVETKRQPLPIREGEPDCAFYMKTGICKFGSTCKFNHPENASATASDGKGVDDVNGNLKSAIVEVSTGPAKPAIGFNAKGLPIRSGETDCPFYMKTGSCKFGSVCRFNHPDVAASSVLQQNHTHGASLLGGLSSTYGAYSSFSGSLPNYGVNLSGSEFGLPTLSQTSIYPQRPGEPACSHYIKTGVCKFTSTCKFHHPLDRKDPNVKVTLAGLPRREGEQACPFYMKTGTCKYGLTCKYDHPPPGEAAAKAVAEAGKSETSDADDVQSP